MCYNTGCYIVTRIGTIIQILQYEHYITILQYVIYTVTYSKQYCNMCNVQYMLQYRHHINFIL